jgi:DNA-binding FrmR family transcriptional regulator
MVATENTRDTTRQAAAEAHECHRPATDSSLPAARGYTGRQHSYLNRLRRIEGQVRGVQKMVADDRWCPDVVNQLAAVTRATEEVAAALLEDHVRHCVLEAARDSGEAGQALMDEVAATIRQVIRL